MKNNRVVQGKNVFSLFIMTFVKQVIADLGCHVPAPRLIELQSYSSCGDGFIDYHCAHLRFRAFGGPQRSKAAVEGSGPRLMCLIPTYQLLTVVRVRGTQGPIDS